MIRTPMVIHLIVAALLPLVVLFETRQPRTTRVAHSAELGFLAFLQSAKPAPRLVGFSPTNHDPRGGRRKVPSAESLKLDLEALRPAFNGLILYGYDKDITPTILNEAKRQGYRAVLLGIWDPKSEVELEGVVALAKNYHKDLALAICVGNEGITFNRYQVADLAAAADKINMMLGPDLKLALCTSEPYGEYSQRALQQFGHILTPNIHSVYDQPNVVNPTEAAAWVRERAMTLAEAAQKPVLVKETGVPNGDGGDMRFTPETQEAFWKAYLKDALLVKSEKHPKVWVSHAAAFEAFCLSWKADESKRPVEGAWGLMSAERKPFAAFSTWKRLAEQTGSLEN